MREYQPAQGTEINYPRTVLGFDFGRRRIGVAVGQELTGTARPIATLPARRYPDWAAIGRLIAQWQPDLLVVGIAYHADSTPNPIAETALLFSRQLHERYQLPVETIDECLSSWEAEDLIAQSDLGRRQRQNKSTIDQVAAALILESWFNQQRT